MRAVKRSPLFRIALLALAVLSAHTGRAANLRHVAPASPPCARKVAAAQPDHEEKLTPAIKHLVRPGRSAHFHTSFPHPLAYSRATSLRASQAAAEITLARRTLYIPPQRDPFALRI